MNYLILYALLIKVVLNQLTEQARNYQQWDILFKNELQLEQQVSQPITNSGGPPQNPDSQENKMLQNLYEQEESMEGLKQNIVRQKDQKMKQDQYDYDQKLMKSLKRQQEKDKLAKQKAKNAFKNGEFKQDKEEYEQLIKPLQKYQSDGNSGEGLLPDEIILSSNLNKITLVSIILIVLILVIQIRIRYSQTLEKHFRKALQQILLDSIIILAIHLFAVVLYYYSFYDVLYLSARESGNQIHGIRLIQLYQIITIPNTPFLEIYDIDVYAYLLLSMSYFLCSLFCNIFYVVRFNHLTKKYLECENEWSTRNAVGLKYQKTLKDLDIREASYKQAVLDRRRPAAQSQKLLKQIKEIQKNLSELRFTVDYLCLKSSFLQPYLYPYLGPSCLRDDFNVAKYLGRVTANTSIKLANVRPLILIYLLLSLAAAGILLYVCSLLLNSLTALILTMLILHGTTFKILVEVNFSLSNANDNIFINEKGAKIEMLTLPKQVWYPTFLDPIFKNKPTYGAKVPQKLLFFRDSPEFTLFLIIYLQRLTLLTNFILYAYLFYYFMSPLWLKLTLLILSSVYTLVILSYLIPETIMQYVQCAYTELLKDYDVIYEVVADQKAEFSRACQHFFEFALHIRRFNSLPLREALIIHRPVLLKSLLDALEPFQKFGQKKQFLHRSVGEQELIDCGVNEDDLGLHLPADKMTDLINKLGVVEVFEHEMLQMVSFCTAKQDDEDPDFKKNLISPLRLLLYIQLRTQEALKSRHELLKDAFKEFITIKIDPDLLVPPFNREQTDDDFTVDLKELEIFLELYCQFNIYDRTMKKILINHLKYHKLTLSRLIDLIANQCDLIPS